MKVFLLGKGVEVERIQDKTFDVTGVVKTFLERAGKIYACCICLDMRNLESKVCSVSTMSELPGIVEESDKVLVF